MGDHIEGRIDRSDLETARALSGLGRFEMWVRYFSLGGQASPLELDAFFNDSMVFTDNEYNIVVHALNECLEEVGVTSFLPLRSNVDRALSLTEPESILVESITERASRARSEAMEMRVSASEMRDFAQRVHERTIAWTGRLEKQRVMMDAQAAELGIELPG